MRCALPLLLALTLTAGPVWANEGLTEKDRELFQWCERLGLPSVAGKTYVKVETGEWQRGCCRVGSGQTGRYGFLLAEDADSFTVVHDLWPIRYPKKLAVVGMPNAGGLKAPTYQKIDFAKELAKRVSGEDKGQGIYLGWSHLVRSQGRPSYNTGVFFLAWAAAQQGEEASAVKLLAEARDQLRPTTWRHQRRFVRIRRPNQGKTQPKPTGGKLDLDATLRKELPRVVLWAAIESCAQPEVPRAELIERFRLLSSVFPSADEVASAQAYIDELERMVAEDMEDEQRTPAAFSAELSSELRELEAPLDELIHSLRDLDLGTPLLHSNPLAHLREGSVSTELLAVGMPAVPRLLEIAEDTRLTRVVNHYPRRRGDPADYVLRYGDVALQLLSRHSGRTFQTQEEASDWWEQVRTHGRLKVLDLMVREGGPDALALANRLLAEEPGRPQRALEAAMAAVVVMRGRNRERLVSFVANQQGAQVRAFLLDEVRRGPDLRARLTAARTLHERGCSLWAEPLVAELRRISEVGARRNSRNARDVLRFVVQKGTPLSLEALRRAYREFAPDEKRYLLESVAGLPRDHSDRAALGEAILVAALDDTTVYPSTWSWSGVRAIDAPIAEIAAVILSRRLDQEFDQSAPPYVRRRRLTELGNLWRGARGLRIRDLPPEPPGPPVADPVELAAAEAALDAAVTPAEVEAALEAYRVIGLAGLNSLKLKAVERSRSREPQVRRTVPQLRTLTFALASTVTQVRVTDETGVLSDDDVAKLQALLARPLTSDQLVKILADTVEARRSTLELSLHRDGGGRGVSLEFVFRPLAEARPTTQLVYSLRVGKSYQRGSHYLPVGKARSGWARFESRARRLLRGQPHTDGELRLRLKPR